MTQYFALYSEFDGRGAAAVRTTDEESDDAQLITRGEAFMNWYNLNFMECHLPLEEGQIFQGVEGIGTYNNTAFDEKQFTQMYTNIWRMIAVGDKCETKFLEARLAPNAWVPRIKPLH